MKSEIIIIGLLKQMIKGMRQVHFTYRIEFGDKEKEKVESDFKSLNPGIKYLNPGRMGITQTELDT